MTIAKLTLRRIDEISEYKRADVIRWLRRMADELENPEERRYAARFTATYDDGK